MFPSITHQFCSNSVFVHSFCFFKTKLYSETDLRINVYIIMHGLKTYKGLINKLIPGKPKEETHRNLTFVVFTARIKRR